MPDESEGTEPRPHWRLLEKGYQVWGYPVSGTQGFPFLHQQLRTLE
jgi:hypothetical protein